MYIYESIVSIIKLVSEVNSHYYFKKNINIGICTGLNMEWINDDDGIKKEKER